MDTTTDHPQAPSVVITRDDLTGHIDDPVCTCFQCHPEWHTGVRCNCPHCISLREGSVWSSIRR